MSLLYFHVSDVTVSNQVDGRIDSMGSTELPGCSDRIKCFSQINHRQPSRRPPLKAQWHPACHDPISQPSVWACVCGDRVGVASGLKDKSVRGGRQQPGHVIHWGGGTGGRRGRKLQDAETGPAKLTGVDRQVRRSLGDGYPRDPEFEPPSVGRNNNDGPVQLPGEPGGEPGVNIVDGEARFAR